MRTISALLFIVAILFATDSPAQNPVIRDQFSADPSAMVVGDVVYLYPSHDIPPVPGQGRPNWFCMEDYHVFSSTDLVNWKDHGVIVSQENVKWANSKAYSMWAPDCIYRNGKYYFYFPTMPADTAYGRGFSIGVAVSDAPYGPFVPGDEPIQKVKGIDPNPFIDKDGQAYLYWSMGKIFVAKLNENMLELDSDPMEIANLPEVGLKEGPYMFERNGKYYLTYPHVQNKTERLEYAMGDHPMGPFKVTGVIMDESPVGCWTNHQSVINFKDQWYLFYHHNDMSPAFDKNRSVRIDSLFFNPDGTIQKVTPTLRGVGATDASQNIEIDRYSLISDTGASIAFMDTLNPFNGWKTELSHKGAWIQYNAVDFGNGEYTSIEVSAKAVNGSVLQIRYGTADGPVVAKVKVPKGASWNIAEVKLKGIQPGIHDLVVVLAGENPVEFDWIRFNKQ